MGVHESMSIPLVSVKSKRYLKVQWVPNGHELPKLSRELSMWYQRVQEEDLRGTEMSKRYLKVQGVPKGTRGIYFRNNIPL